MSQPLSSSHREVVLIVGMHRSGTSLLSRFITSLGYHLGKNEMLPSFDNPDGFFENQAIVNFNDRILGRCRSRWDLPVLTKTQLQRPLMVDDFISEFGAIFTSEFQNKNRIVIKDPRICLLLPLYLAFFDSLKDIVLNIIWIIRHPESVAKSLFNRDKFNRYKTDFLYARYNLDTYKSLEKRDYLLISFEDMILNPQEIDIQIKKYLSHIDLNNRRLDQLIAKPIGERKNIGSAEDSEREYGDQLYNLLTSEVSYEDKDNKIRTLIEKIDKETRIVDSWTQKKYFSQLIGVDQEKKKSLIDSFRASSGWNVIQWINTDSIELKALEFIPFNEICTFHFTEVLINGQDVRWESRSMISSDGKLFSSSKYASLLLDSNDLINEVYIRYYAEVYDHDTADLHTVVQNKIELEQLKTEFESILNKSTKEKRELEALLHQQTTAVKNEDTTEGGRIDDRYQKTLEHLIQSYTSRLESYKENIAQMSVLISNVNNALNTTTEGQKNYELLDSRLSELSMEIRKMVGHYNSRLDDLTEDIYAKNNLLQQKEADLASLKLKVENADSTNLELEKDRKHAWSVVEQQHKEILDFKSAYTHRVNELRDVESSFSYKVGRVITWPIRLFYESFHRIPAAILILMPALAVLVRRPVALLKEVNTTNLNTLWRALDNEHPKHILYNLKKKIGISRTNKSTSHLTPPITTPNSKGQRKVLYISPNLPDYDQSSGGRRAAEMLRLIAPQTDLYIYTLGKRPEEYKEHFRSIGAYVFDTHNHNIVIQELPHVDVIIFAWFYALHQNYALYQYYNSAHVIVDSVDVHWVREQRSLGVVEGLTPVSIAANKKSEIESYSLADTIWAVTANDKNAILEELPEANVNIVSNIHDVYLEDYQPTESRNLLFFGGFNHPPNVVAVKILVEEILPEILKSFQNVKLIIAGSNAPDQVKKYGELEYVDYRGFVLERDIPSLYRDSFLAIAPLTAGAGIKGKICEAISYATPVLTTDIGNEGIDLEDGVEAFICPPGEMPQKLTAIFSDPIDLDAMVARAKEKLAGIVGHAQAQNQMLKDINPMVSICIVTWNKLELLKPCLESIFEHTTYPFFRVVVHSNGCSDGTQEYLTSFANHEKRLIPLLSDKNEVFVRPNNNMMNTYSDSDILLLNNDTIVTPRWLSALREAAYKSTEIGISGSKLLYPDGRLQEFGSELYEDGTGMNIGKGDDPDKDSYQKIKRVGYVSGCAMYIKRSTINKIGVFDDQFHPCYCEDSDYAYTAWEQGLETVVTPDSVVIHYEGGTSGTDEDSGFKAYQKENFKKFLHKHKNNLSSVAAQIEKINGAENDQ